MNTIKAMFLSRLKSNAPAGIRSDIEAAFDLVDALTATATKIRADQNLTAQGRSEAIRAAFGGDLMANFRRLQGNVKKAREHLATQRLSLLPRAPDRSDTFGEMQRSEIRTWLRSLPEGQRWKQLDTADKSVREAIIFAPAALSGMPEDRHALLIQTVMQETHGAQLADLEGLEDAIENAEAAIQVAGQNLQTASGLTIIDFQAVAA